MNDFWRRSATFYTSQGYGTWDVSLTSDPPLENMPFRYQQNRPPFPQYSRYSDQPLLAYVPCCLMLSCSLLPLAVSVWVIKVHDKKLQAMLSKMHQWFVCSANMISCSQVGCLHTICSTFSTLQHASSYQCVQNLVNRANKNMHISISGGPNCLRVHK